ncbi:MAG TPA: response regulator transcription factor, partial [Longimicrobiales bacterium]
MFDVLVEVGTGSEAIDQCAARRPDLVVLDLGLPDVSGTSVCAEIRKWSQAPIIVLSARHTPEEKAILLDAGADDYMTKPFSTVELQARARAMLRRSQTHSPTGTTVQFDDIIVDLSGRTIKRKGESIHLTPTEWDLLRA